jgi:hypothetical protein
MWKIEQFDFPFCEAKNVLMNCWKSFIENFKVPYTVLSERMSAILEGVCLTDLEIFDVEASWEEIKKGQPKRFTDIDEFLKDLKS